jgi:butyrate kinase
MGQDKSILVVNPGSTSIKVAVFRDSICINKSTINHRISELKGFLEIADQLEFRMNAVTKWMRDEGIDESSLEAVVGRGGLLRPTQSGTYVVTEKMVEDLKAGAGGQHAANLGGMIAKEIADRNNILAFVVDPVSVDELEDIARVSGIPEIERKSLIHALNIKSVCRYASKELGRDVLDLNMIACHLGGGISIAPVKCGRLIDVNNASESGPFSPDRAGSLPAGNVIELAFSGKLSLKEIKDKISVASGLAAYLGTNDVIEIDKRIEDGDKYAKLIFEAMAYQISKEIGAMATVLYGKVDAIILTGGLANSKRLVDIIIERVKFISIAPILIYPGEMEMVSLYEGALRVLEGFDKAKVYEDEVFKNGREF